MVGVSEHAWLFVSCGLEMDEWHNGFINCRRRTGQIIHDVTHRFSTKCFWSRFFLILHSTMFKMGGSRKWWCSLVFNSDQICLNILSSCHWLWVPADVPLEGSWNDDLPWHGFQLSQAGGAVELPADLKLSCQWQHQKWAHVADTGLKTAIYFLYWPMSLSVSH